MPSRPRSTRAACFIVQDIYPTETTSMPTPSCRCPMGRNESHLHQRGTATWLYQQFMDAPGNCRTGLKIMARIGAAARGRVPCRRQGGHSRLLFRIHLTSDEEVFRAAAAA